MDLQSASIAQLPAYRDSNSPLGVIQEEASKTVEPKHESPGDSDEPSPDSDLPPSKRARINYECAACGTTYTEKRALARHRHTDMHRRRLGLQPDKRHLCQKCGRSFGRNHDLQRHRREQHGEITGAQPIDLSSCASDGSEHRSLSSDDSAKSISGASWQSGMTAMTIPDDMAGGVSLRTTKSLADFRGKSDDSRDSRSGSMDWSHTPIKVEASHKTIKPWPGEPAEEEQDIVEDIVQPRTKKDKKPSRRHSSVSLRASETPATASDTPDTAYTRPSLSKSSAPNSQDLVEQVPNPRSKPRRVRETVLTSPVPENPQDIDTCLAEPRLCMMCQKSFGEDDALIDHLYKHLESFKGKHRCKKCEIGFDHEEDLQAHLDAAKKGHCGFNFEHSQTCTGHHPPPREDDSDRLSDSDCLRLENQLRHWEQAQLRAYIAEINTLVAARNHRRRHRWSVEALIRNKRNSSHSFSSFAISVNTYASAPCDETNGIRDVEGLQKRLKFMSIKDMGASVKHRISGGKYHPTKPLPPPATFDKALFQAIHRGNLKKAEEILTYGTDPGILLRAPGTLMAAALWDHNDVQSLVVAHRLTEDIQGHCDQCHMNSATFNKGATKVRAILAHGAHPSQAGGLCGSPILSAAWMCNPAIVKMLIQHGAAVNQRCERFGSPLGVAASQAGHPGSMEVAAVLINAGANVDIAGQQGTPVEVAKGRRRFWGTAVGAGDARLCAEDVESRVESCDHIIKMLESNGGR